ncbi:pyruvate formate lyase activating enzyme [Cladochytrium replicatum]|nr:pyruvate formate lyase activating enzyme [Cladochytrium replicatum]
MAASLSQQAMPMPAHTYCAHHRLMDLEDLVAEHPHSHHSSVDPPTPDEDDRDYLSQVGYVHSIESLAALEGPGNRFLIFLSGCKARCLYCENPDTWDIKNGTKMSVQTLIEKASHYTPYYEHSYKGGGITVSGGDPFVQYNFTASILRAAKRHLNLHTCVETTGQATKRAWDTVLPYTDLVLLCIKGTDEDTYRKVTRTMGLKRVEEFIKELEGRKIEWWCRYVVLPGYTDSDADVERLVQQCSASPTLSRIELLPYHTLGKHKWESLKVEYPLEGVPGPTKESILRIAGRIREGMKNNGRGSVVVTSGVE